MFLALLIFNLFAPLAAFKTLGKVWKGRGFGFGHLSKSEAELVQAFANISRLNFNTVYFLVKDSENVYYNSSLRPIRSRFDPLKLAVNEANRLGLETHAWFVVFYDSWLLN